MIRNNPAESRYEFVNDGQVVAVAEYRKQEHAVVFTHTETLPGHEGHGYASQLARMALDEAAAQGWGVVPACPFIARFIGKHPEYEKLVVQA